MADILSYLGCGRSRGTVSRNWQVNTQRHEHYEGGFRSFAHDVLRQ